MSARSPRGSLSGATSAEVADDFGESLKDLQINNRYEISNLTLIAKENTEYAQAISKVLENHIKTTAPTRKLPALYVLDSIIKNVGTPYTVYLGRNLYSTFMDAYTLVDSTTRRNMEAMLKTWKEAVPGSMDPRPVFATETVRPIENALIKAKTAALQSNRLAHAPPDFRNTPTPPQYDGRFGPPANQAQHPPYYGYGNQQPQPPPQSHQAHFYQYPPVNQQVVEVEAVRRDVSALVSRRQAEFGANPFDQGLQKQLKALLDLQSILNTTQLDAGSLQQIRGQVSALSGAGPSSQRPTPQPSIQTPPQWQAPQQLPHLAQPQAPYLQPPSAQPPQAASLFPPGALDGLQALLSNGQKPGTPQMRDAAPALQHASHTQLTNLQKQTAAAPALNGDDLMTSLAKSGLLLNTTPAVSTPPVTASTTVPLPQSTADLLKSLQHILPPASQTGTPTLAPAQLPQPSRSKIPLTSASLKTFRPELVHALYEAQPNQCNTCGRRFLTTDEGRAKKDRHLDWHFRTNQRIADPSINRGAHRDWFVPELEWIQTKTFDASTTTAADAAAAGAGAKKVPKPEELFVRAPPGVTRNTCSICFEEMKSSYSEDLQDWVFLNARMLGGKIVHATCLLEMQKGMQGSRGRSATPEGSLGKRKAEEKLYAGAGARVKTQ